jgi:hypothetical protein
MDIAFLLVLLSFPVLLQVCLAIFVYVDAPDVEMDRRTWTLVALLVPIFGFFTYLLERAERTSEPPDDDQFVDGPFRIHKSRADDTPVVSTAPDADDLDDTEDAGDDNKLGGADENGDETPSET